MLRLLIGIPQSSDFSKTLNCFERKFAFETATVDEVLSIIRYDVHADLANGLGLYIGAYANSLQRIGRSEFTLLLQDLYSSSPESFGVIIENIWDF